ncbi:hypothetical protein ASPTUDRAFT_48101 [Aspergillus tubingensis CBS 134.48]|uniref:Uncharacterized protein n=1 Tax=Aspergillus tubingensis (strain CBS 134.48) TaxID=767770 RepID=A0A1L9MQY2_ASPTC|nr:hypothetical protein ASPTUDRAFT_48101 [Aspergillus tubingensis CBS 134.48]
MTDFLGFSVLPSSGRTPVVLLFGVFGTLHKFAIQAVGARIANLVLGTKVPLRRHGRGMGKYSEIYKRSNFVKPSIDVHNPRVDRCPESLIRKTGFPFNSMRVENVQGYQ